MRKCAVVIVKLTMGVTLSSYWLASIDHDGTSCVLLWGSMEQLTLALLCLYEPHSGGVHTAVLSNLRVDQSSIK